MERYRYSMKEKSILATIVYYDCLDMALSTFEVWSRLVRPLNMRSTKHEVRSTKFSLYEVITTLEKSGYLKKYIVQKNGFWSLRGREALVAKRIEAMKESEEKLKRLFLSRWVFLLTPFMQAAFVSGSVAGGWVREESDIDILVVAKKGRIWTARLFLTLFTSILGIRRRGNLIANQICLNHYINEDSLQIPFKSLYNAHTYVNLIPLIDRKGTLKRFFKKNSWIQSYVWQSETLGESEEYIYQFPVRRFLERFTMLDRGLDELVLSGILGDMVERAARLIQLYRIKQNPLTGKAGGRIQADDFQLEFHPASKEKAILTRYNKRLKQLELGEFYPEEDSGLK